MCYVSFKTCVLTYNDCQTSLHSGGPHTLLFSNGVRKSLGRSRSHPRPGTADLQRVVGLTFVLSKPPCISQSQTFTHTDAFTHRRFYTQTPVHPDAFTHRHFYTQTLLHTDAFTHRLLYTQTLLHTDTFTHRPFTHRHFYTQTILHTFTFTHRSF